jgi:hypothetical protein
MRSGVLYIFHINVSSGKPQVESHWRYRFFPINVYMTSKHGARAIHYKFFQLYRFSACTVIIPMDPTHLIRQQGIFLITNPHPTLQGIYLRTNPHPILQGVNSDSQTYESKVYLRVELPPHEWLFWYKITFIINHFTNG